MSTVVPAWMTSAPGGGLPWPLLVAWTAAAVVTTTVLAAAAVRVVALTRRTPAGGWKALVPVLPGFAAGGVSLLVMMPGMMTADGYGYFTALGFLSPWTLGLSATAWLRGRAAMTALIAVAASAVLFLVVAFSAELHSLLFPPPDEYLPLHD
ncbi:hypothetical protein [Actinoplanes sp. NPDC048796]|uniref:hypothetical protein n=1 Tax=Actinoplanes sp. NPDC048796 TaxID=3155640 RepID=UPI0033BFE0E8